MLNNKFFTCCGRLAINLLLLAIDCTGIALAQQAQSAPVDNGTDPTKFSTAIFANYELIETKSGISNGTLRINYVTPFGSNMDYGLRLRVPLVRSGVFSNNGYALGDVSVMLQHVFVVTKQQAFVWQAELVLNTASRPELGSGKKVLKPVLIYARFLEGGAIFAPAIKHSLSLGGDSKRGKVNTTDFDFYYVPKLSAPHNLITVDPALSVDWETNKYFGSMAVTFGRVIGPMFGGSGIISIKPLVFAGADRPGKWGLELGFKVIEF